MSETAARNQGVPDHDAIRIECQRLRDEEGLPHKRQAKLAGVPYGTFSNYIAGTYGGNLDRVAVEIQKWLDSRREQAAAKAILPPEPGFIETPTARHAMSIFAFAQTAPDVVVLAGAAGLGKTMAARQYKATHPNVFVATMEPQTSGVYTMLLEIGEAIGIEERTAARLMRSIGKRLTGSEALLIVDEAQHLQTAALDQVRALHDKWGVGIALVGNETVYSRLEGEGRKSSLAQLFSRVGMRMTQAKPRAADVEALIDAWDIEDKRIVRVLTGIAAKPGALRGMTKVVRLATMLARAAEETLSEVHVRAAWRQLGNAIVE